MEHPHDDRLDMAPVPAGSNVAPSSRPCLPHHPRRWRTTAAFVTAFGTLMAALVVSPVLQLVSPGSAAANDWPPPSKVADASTADEFPGVLTSDYFTNSNYKGRIWTDKSVTTSSMTVGATAGSTTPHVIQVGVDELGVSLSALGSSRSVLSSLSAPVDLSLVLSAADLQAKCVDSTATSDGWCNDPNNYTGSRAYAMVQAVEKSIETLASSDSRDRVAIIAFSNSASIISSLGTPTKISGTDVYVQLIGPTSTDGTMTLKTATNSIQIGPSGSVVHASNLQLGLVYGMSVLANQPTANVSGANQRLPEVIVFTSSAPTVSSNSGAAGSGWWKVGSTTPVQGPGAYGDPQFYGNGLLAALAASFLKNKIADVYNDETYNTANNLTAITPGVYTIGMDLSSLGPLSERPLAQAALDPSHVAQQQANAPSSAVADFIAKAADYTAGRFVQAQVSATGSLINIGHPSDVADAAYDPTTIGYNTAFYSPLTAADASSAFASIIDKFTTPPRYPSEIEGGASPAVSGYVTFTDPLGPFMQVRDMDSVTFCVPTPTPTNPPSCKQTTFANPTTTDLGGGLTRYTFSGTVNASVIAGATPVSDLVVTVQRYDTLARGDVVTVKVPAALLPVRYETVMTTASGAPVSMAVQEAQPMQVDYVVGPKPGVIDALSNPDSLNSATSQDGIFLRDYVAAHSSAGQVRFYSNDYTVGGDGTIAPDTSATWIPSVTNDFYRFSIDTPLYTNSALTTPLTSSAWAALSPNATIWYYLKEYRYVNASQTSVNLENIPMTTTKATLQAAMAAQPNQPGVVSSGGNMVVSAGTLDFARTDQLDQVKCLNLSWSNGNPVCADAASGTPGNLTGTATMVRQTTYDSTVVETGLGNNGYLSFILPSTLTITPTVSSASGLSPATGQQFPIHLTMTNADGSVFTHVVDYAIFSGKDMTTAISSSSLSSPATLSLQAGQVAVVQLPQNVTYSVTEDVPPGYTLSPAAGVTGTTGSAPSQAKLVNTYAPTAATVAQGPTVAATLDNSTWDDGETFTVQMCPSGGASSDCKTKTLTSSAQSTAFDPVAFNVPGVYTYTLSELPEQAIDGVSYSDAIYTWTVTVTDDGQGRLQASSVLSRRLDDVGTAVSGSVAQASFVNTEADSTYRAQLVATVLVDDQSTQQLRIPEHSYDFQFSYVGVDLADPDASDPGVEPPDFDGTTAVTSSGSVITGPGVLLTTDDVGHTWFYKAVETGTPPSAAVTLSDDAWFRSIQVRQGANGGIVPVMTNCHTTVDTITADQPLGGCQATVGSWTSIPEDQRQFIIGYAPEATTTTAHGDVTLQGRPWQDSTSDNLTFTVAPNDDATRAAIQAGYIQGDEQPEIDVTYDDVDQATNTAQIDFEAFHYTRQGQYQFAVTQQIPSNPSPGITYDTHTAIVDVTVDDPGATGTLRVDVSVRGNADDDDTVHFVNRYRASLQYTGVTAVLGLDGRAIQLGEFAFKVTGDDAASCARGMFDASCSLTVANGSGNADPSTTVLDGNFRFTQADLGTTYSYTVRQVDTGEPGVTYDTTAYDVALRPQFDPATGAMYIVTTISRGGQEIGTYDSRTSAVPSTTFHDTYRVVAGTAEPTFSLDILGRDWNPGESFDFTMSAVTPGAPMPAHTSVTLASALDANDFSFGAITYNQPGTYRYSVAEVVPVNREPGLTYDTVASVVTVTVADTGLGQLQTTLAYDGSEDFVNSYRTVVSFNLDVNTVLRGAASTPNMFAFELVPQDGGAANIAGLTDAGTQWANSAASPDGTPETMQPLPQALRFTQDQSGSTFSYQVRELAAPTPVDGVVYDPNTYTVTFAVQDDNAGTLTVTTTVTGPDGVVATFVNRSTDATQADPHVDFVNTVGQTPPPADWTLSSTSWPSPGSSVRPGDKIRYTLTVTPGANPASGVVVTSDLSGVLAHAAMGDIDAPAGTTAGLDGTTLTWTVGALTTQLALSYTVTVGDDALGATLSSSVSGDSSGQGPQACSSDDPCQIGFVVTEDAPVPTWSLTALSQPISGSEVPAGGTITYSLTATPANGVVSEAVVVDDLSGVLGHATLGTVDAPAGTKAVMNGSTLTWTIGDLSRPLALTFTVTVASSADGMALSSAFWGQAADSGPDGPVTLLPSQCTIQAPCTTIHRITAAINSSSGGTGGGSVPVQSNSNGGSSVPAGGTPGSTLDMPGAGPWPFLVGVFMIAALICGSTLLRRARERHSLG